MPLDIESELDAIYVLPPGQFTSARNQLEKRLKAAGQKPEASQVKALAKPKLTAWLVNLLALRHPAALTELRDAGTAILRAQQTGDTSELGQASASRKSQIKALVALSQAACSEHGEKLGAAAERELVTCLETLASLTGDAAEPPGRMTQPLAAAGFDAFGIVGLAAVGPAASSPTPNPELKSRVRAAKAAGKGEAKGAETTSNVESAEAVELRAKQRAAEERKRAREQLTEQLSQAEAQLRQLAEQITLARGTLESAQARREETQQALEANQARVAEAELELVRVRSELSRSQRDLERDQQSVQSHTKGLRQIVEQQAPAQELVGKLKDALKAVDSETERG